MNDFFKIDERLEHLSDEVKQQLKPIFEQIDATTEYNQQKMLSAFIKNGVSESHFAASTGYGYDDRGRETLERVFADAMGAEDALIRHNFVSGTHTLTVALFGVLRPGDTVLCVTGTPYDTIQYAFGIKKASGSLKEFGVNYEQIDLKADGSPDLEAIKQRLEKGSVKMVYIQRSRGYSLRPSLFVSDIESIVKAVRKIDKKAVIMVDNCYGEFVEKKEPLAVGADLIAGSLIKNPGGGIAPTGGYIAGRADLIEQCANRLNAPGVGKELGATLGHTKELFMGIFNAPHVTGEALKTAVFASGLFSRLGFEVSPASTENRADIIQVICLKNETSLISFCKGMQKGSPIDSFVTPEPSDMPGYDCKVIMAAGAFHLGASIELSADAPLREPYAVFMQGGLNFHSACMGITLAAQSCLEDGVFNIK